MHNTDRPVLVLGGGVTGMQTALTLESLGLQSVLLEKSDRLGGHVKNLSGTFPLFNDRGFSDGREFIAALEQDVRASATVRTDTELRGLVGDFPRFEAILGNGERLAISAVVVATGFVPFAPASLPEYGYGVIPDVITAMELEEMLNPRGPTKGELKRKSDGRPARRLAIVFCVGSRNPRLGAPFCSRLCCAYSTKQASTVMERNPQATVVCFYMDVRTYDRGFEEMYTATQARGVQYIRGRVSGCRPLPDGSVAVRAENTLLGRPFTGTFDLVSLSTGMRPRADTKDLATMLGVDLAADGFFLGQQGLRQPRDSTRNGVMLAGCATGMKPIRDCIIEANAVASRLGGLLRVV